MLSIFGDFDLPADFDNIQLTELQATARIGTKRSLSILAEGQVPMGKSTFAGQLLFSITQPDGGPPELLVGGRTLTEPKLSDVVPVALPAGFDLTLPKLSMVLNNTEIDRGSHELSPEEYVFFSSLYGCEEIESAPTRSRSRRTARSR